MLRQRELRIAHPTRPLMTYTYCISQHQLTTVVWLREDIGEATTVLADMLDRLIRQMVEETPTFMHLNNMWPIVSSRDATLPAPKAHKQACDRSVSTDTRT
jgi:hypothetical protein